MRGIAICRMCGQVQRVGDLPPGSAAACCHCGWTIARAKSNSLARTAAFTLAALILYVPANIYPMLRMEYYGVYTENTVWAGCVRLFQDGQWVVATIVFLASILIPLSKLLALFFLVVTAKIKSTRWQHTRTWVYQIIEVIGKWAMLDVFLLAILVALVRLETLARVMPGPGLLAFTSVVIFTMLASASFDPKLIWRQPEGTA